MTNAVEELQKEVEAQRHAEKLEYDKACLLAHQTFAGNEFGKEFLSNLKERLLLPVIPEGTSEAEGRLREGENRLIRYIIQLVEHHKKTLRGQL